MANTKNLPRHAATRRKHLEDAKQAQQTESRYKLLKALLMAGAGISFAAFVYTSSEWAVLLAVFSAISAGLVKCADIINC